MSDNIQKKIAKWELLKKSILEILPKDIKIAVEGLDDESKYFHPIIKIDNYIIKAQGDTEADHIYGWGLEVEQILGCFIHTISLGIDNLEQLKQVIVGWKKYKPKIEAYLEICKTINENIELLAEIKRNIEGNLINDTLTEEYRKACISNLFMVKEWLENERIIENYK
jgi:hypothetical protein